MPVTQVASGTPVGVRYAQYWLRGSDGRAYGTTGEGAANGTTMHAKLMRFPKTANLPDPQRVVTAITGGDRFLGQVMFGANDLGAFQFTTANWDSLLAATATRAAADTTTNARWRRTSPNQDQTDLPAMGLMFSVLFQSRDDDSDGTNLWINYIVPNCQVAGSFSQASYQAAAEITWTCTPNYSLYEPHGLAFSAGAMALANNRCLAYAIITPKPLALTSFIGNAVLTTFTLGFKPASTVVTLSNTPNEMVKNGTPTALSSINTSTSVATLSAAGVAADYHGALYETDFLPAA